MALTAGVIDGDPLGPGAILLTDGTIRKLYAKSIGENSVHGSDSAENAAIEIVQFFGDDDIVG